MDCTLSAHVRLVPLFITCTKLQCGSLEREYIQTKYGRCSETHTIAPSSDTSEHVKLAGRVTGDKEPTLAIEGQPTRTEATGRAFTVVRVPHDRDLRVVAIGRCGRFAPFKVDTAEAVAIAWAAVPGGIGQSR